MDINFTFNVIQLVTSTLAWGTIIFFAYRIYKKAIVKPKVWKIVIVIFVGIFSFSINWNMFDVILKFPIVPLGVWILYFIFRRKEERWKTYRSFAWLGFWANFLFLASTLIAMPIHQVIYLKDELTTYISNVDNASIIRIHTSAKERTLNKESLTKQFHTMTQEAIFNEQWYADTYMDTVPNQRSERFPYELIGTSPKWGSGIDTIIFIEEDGKGILLSTPNNQLYFRSEGSMLEGVQ